MEYSVIKVKNLPSNMEKDDVLGLFSRIGPVAYVRVMYNLRTGQPRGEAYIEYEQQGCSGSAIAAFDNTYIYKNAHNIYVSRREQPGYSKISVVVGQHRAEYDNVSPGIVISSLPLRWTRNDIYDIFRGFGCIRDMAVLKRRSDDRYHGHCYIRYSSEDEAIQAVRKLDNVKMYDSSWPLHIQYANPSNVDQMLAEMGVYRAAEENSRGEPLCTADEIKQPNESEAREVAGGGSSTWRNIVLEDAACSSNIEYTETDRYRDMLFKSIALEL